jgi:hypothetical protein
LGTLKYQEVKEASTGTQYVVTFVEDGRTTQVKVAELREFMGEYYGVPRLNISITWQLAYNSDSTVTIRLKLLYSDTGCPNDEIRLEKITEILISEFEIVYQNFFNPNSSSLR